MATNIERVETKMRKTKFTGSKYLMLVGKIRYIQRLIKDRRYGDLDSINADLSKAISDIEKSENEYINEITRKL